MPKSYLNAEPYGIGELISRKKHLKVPPHQRDYAWGADEVDQLLEDLFFAIDSQTEEYFLGLLVIVGPTDGNWMVLDGQQRLATCTMVLAAVRFWLRQLSRGDDADQIQRQFISVRRLGGSDEPRLTMNHTNRELFSLLVQPDLDSDEIRRRKTVQVPGTSNDKLIDAFLTCRQEVGQAMQKLQQSDQDAFLYRLADFIENQAQIVCLEVDQAADAYRIFEALNDRGMALSSLDLVKNFAFGTVGEEKHTELAEMWEEMASQIVDSDAEDFLKVAWTAKFGRVQRGALYSLIRAEYSTESEVLDLIKTLALQAELYTALLEPTHHVWAEYGLESAALVATLRDLRARQVRPIVLAALDGHVSPDQMSTLLRHLVTLTVRYQTVGRRRTGLLEIACAKAAKELSSKHAGVTESIGHLASLVSSDQEFLQDFERYRERNSKRAIHILFGVESILACGEYRPDWIHEKLSSEDVVVSPLVSKYTPKTWTEMEDPGFIEDVARRLGNLFLLSRNDAKQLRTADLPTAVKIIANSSFSSTSAAHKYFDAGRWGRGEIMERQRDLAVAASQCWAWEPTK